MPEALSTQTGNLKWSICKSGGLSFLAFIDEGNRIINQSVESTETPKNGRKEGPYTLAPQ
jgi:hypothetical protein